MARENDKVIEKANYDIGTLTGDDAVKRMAELQEKWEMDYNSAIGTAERRGHEAGMVEEKTNIAKKLLSKNMPIDQITEITGMQEEEILKLKENN